MTLFDEVKAIREGAAVLLRADVATLSLTGPDRARFLNGMVSNEVEALAPGQGVLAAKTSAKGRVEAVLRVRARTDELRLDLQSAVAEKVRATLDQFIIMDDCAIADATASRDVVSVFGPDARRIVEAAGLGRVPAELAPHAFVELDGVTAIADATLGLFGLELHVAPGSGAASVEKLVAAGARLVSADALDVARIEAGTPLDGRDLDDETFPMEARLERALSFTKGCYIGQEVIARATNFGGVKHILVGLVLDGEALPEVGAPLHVEGSDQRTGELTSIARSPTLGRSIALGYVRKTEDAPGTKLVVASEKVGRIGATVSALPFV